MLKKVSASSVVSVEKMSKRTTALFATLALVTSHESDCLLSAFFHKKSFAGSDAPYVGQNVSFVFEEGLKGAAAVKVKEEEGGVALEEVKEEEEEGEREMGKVKVCKRTSPKEFSFCGTSMIQLG